MEVLAFPWGMEGGRGEELREDPVTKEMYAVLRVACESGARARRMLPPNRESHK